MVAGHLGEDPVLVEERPHHELCEQPGLTALDQLPQPFRGRSGGRAELDRPHEPCAAHLAHHLVALGQGPRELEQPLTHLGGARYELLIVDGLQGRQTGRGSEVVRCEGRAVHHGALHAVEDRVEDLPGRQQGADRDVAARERLRQSDQVGLEAPVLGGEEAAGAAEAGLHLVRDEERAVPAAELLGAREAVGGRDPDALALDRLEDERGNVAAA